METITLNIDGREVKTEAGKTVLEAALAAGIYIPTLCYHRDLSPWGACRLCVVQIEKMRGFPTACTMPASAGMVIQTKSPQIDEIRRVAMKLMLATHPMDCPTCEQNLNCELQAVAQYLGINKQNFRVRPKDIPRDSSNPLFDHDLSKCILCGRCVRACYELRGVGVLSFIGRGRQTYIGTAFHRPLVEAYCKFCGACVEVCPTGALKDKKGLLASSKTREAALVPCKYTCPANIDIPRYIHFVNEKKYSEAAAVVRERVPFPMALGLVCNHPCEAVCRRGDINKPISIRGLKRIAAEKDEKTYRKNIKKLSATGKKVAVVGAGPAGLTAAYYLAKQGHKVTVFEALPAPGGMLRVGIPEYRLPKKVLDAEIEEIKNVAGFDIKISTRIESLDELFSQGYKAVYLAIGAHQGNNIGVEGDTSPGVFDAIALLRDAVLGQKVKLGNKVAVIGGGNVAIDAARTALRLGAKDVSIIYRRTRAEMPANPEEIEGALEEGVKLVFLAAPNRVFNENGILKLQCVRMELGERDASGRQRPVPVKGSEYETNFDSIISAIGQKLVVPEAFKVATGKGDVIKVADGCVTSREGVFAGGDAVTTPASVIEAIASGRKGAIAIDKYLGGDGNIDEVLAPIDDTKASLGCMEGFANLPRAEFHFIPVDKRLGSFAEVEKGYDEKEAVGEASRCLKCDLRLKISPVKFPPKRRSTKNRG